MPPYYYQLPKFSELTPDQRSILSEPGAIAISGGPGTGKSFVCLWRHIRNCESPKPSLLLTYTKTLHAFLTGAARAESQIAAKNVDKTERWYNDNYKKRYHEIIIDEAQDQSPKTHRLIKKHAVLVSYGADDFQILYPSHCCRLGELKDLFRGNVHRRLYANYRNNYDILLFAKSLFRQVMIPQDTLDEILRDPKRRRNRQKPIALKLKNRKEAQDKAIVDIVKTFDQADKDGLHTHNIGILVAMQSHVHRYKKVLEAVRIDCSTYASEQASPVLQNVHVTTFKSAKGTEWDTVIIPDFHKLREISAGDRMQEADYYVAITRAKRNLFLLSDSDLSFLDPAVCDHEAG